MEPYTNDHGLRDYRAGIATCSDTAGGWLWGGLTAAVAAALIGVLAHVFL